MTTLNHTSMEASELSTKQDMYLKVITSTLIAILIVLTLLGNFLVMAAFCLCKELRTITNYFLFSLSLADLLTALLAMPIFMASKITRDGSFFPGGAVFYDVWRSIDIICGTASIWNLCLVSLDRLLAVAAPLRHLVIVTPASAKAVIVLVWTSSLSLSGILHMNWNYKGILITFISFFLPLFIIISSYVKIYQVTTRSCILRRIGGTQLKRDIRSAKQMVVVISVFILCWVGFFVLTLILSIKRSMSSTINPAALDFLKSLTYLNSCINPLLFTMVSRTFKKAITDILHCHKPNLTRARRQKYLGTRRNNNMGSFFVSSILRRSSSIQEIPGYKREHRCPQIVTYTERETCL